MNTPFFTILVFCIAIVMGHSVHGQTTILGNHPIDNTEYLGWDADTQFPLYIRHENDKGHRL